MTQLMYTVDMIEDLLFVSKMTTGEKEIPPITNQTCEVPPIMQLILRALQPRQHWQLKVRALQVCNILLTSSKDTDTDWYWSFAPELLPLVTDCLTDAKIALQMAAEQFLETYCHLCFSNTDLALTEKILRSCMKSPSVSAVAESVHALAATTFVNQVTLPMVAFITPILLRALSKLQVTAIKRKACIVIANLARLVDDANTVVHARSFWNTLIPEVKRVSEETADPECRQVATSTLKTLEMACQSPVYLTADSIRNAVRELVPTILNEKECVVAYAILEYYYARQGCIHLPPSCIQTWEQDWLGTDRTRQVLERMSKLVTDHTTMLSSDQTLARAASEMDPSRILCTCEFSLAYGAKILLSHAKLNLVRGHRYGLCGPNGVGKSTLLRAIANHQLDGFPPADVLKTIYVEHDIDASEADTTVAEFIGTPDAVAQLQTDAFGFDPSMMTRSIGSMSGGWKMKLALARAMLSCADVYLLDEPTNHLDTMHVAWLIEFVRKLDNATCIIVSHDSLFLEAVCTDILHYTPNRKLGHYQGTLSRFIECVPEAKVYQELKKSSDVSFSLPEPGFLEGVKTKDKAILKLDRGCFSYGPEKDPVLTNVSVSCCLSSRIACVGANGAGKSTLIKGITGELEPVNAGSIWRHPNVRMAYVAQHAFHHIEHHLDKTPVQYIQWRFAPGDDREAMQKVSRQDTTVPSAGIVVAPDGIKRSVEKIVARRKLRRDYEYEVEWSGLSIDQTSWLTRDQLETMGLTKMVNDMDMREAASQGLLTRALTTANVQKHLADLGLDAEVATHTMIKSLSGGQKVKLVLGAATWLQPHLIVLDEPTNYLDRESLAALADALHAFGGGVIVISHARSFLDAIPCLEVWQVQDGSVTVTRDINGVAVPSLKLVQQQTDEMIDMFGNTVKVTAKPKSKDQMSNKEKKQRAKMRKARRERGEDVSSSDSDKM